MSTSTGAHRRRRIGLAVVVTLVAGGTLVGCSTPPAAVGAVVDKHRQAGREESGRCMGDGVTTALSCTADREVPATYFIVVQRTDARYVEVEVSRRVYRSTDIGARFDANDYNFANTWEMTPLKDGKWAYR